MSYNEYEYPELLCQQVERGNDIILGNNTEIEELRRIITQLEERNNELVYLDTSLRAEYSMVSE